MTDDEAVAQLAMFMQTRDARQYGQMKDGKPVVSWGDCGSIAQDEYTKDAQAYVRALRVIGWNPEAAS